MADENTPSDTDNGNQTIEVSKSSVEPKGSFISALHPRNVYRKLRSMDRNTGLAVVLALILIIVGVVAFISTQDSPATEELATEQEVQPTQLSEPLGAELQIVEGTIEVKSEESDWEDADAGTQIEQGMSIRTTGATSRAVVAVDDGSAVRVGPNSEIFLETLITDRVVVKHVSGYVYNRVLPSDSRDYVVTSEDAQYEAQGTAFMTIASGDEQAVEVYHSSVVETGTNLEPKEGEKLIVKSRVSPSDDGTIKELDIDDVKEDDFIKWNRELDAESEDYKNSLGFLSDFDAPELTIDQKDGAVILLEPSAKEGTIELSGTIKDAYTLKVSSGDETIDVPFSDGKYTTPVLKAKIGSTTFTLTARDRAGNESKASVRITFQRKSAAVTVPDITLSDNGSSGDTVKLSWQLKAGFEAPDGLKIVYSTSSNPGYSDGESSSVPVSADAGSYEFKGFPSGTHYFRACEYQSESNTCTNYSNEVTVTVP